jgi:hypothetical protein
MLNNALRTATALAAVAMMASRLIRPAAGQETTAPYRVGFLAQPASCEPAWIRKIEWNRENVGKLKSLGFTVIQVDVAWIRPDDEILNLEDLIELSPDEQKDSPQPVPLRSKPGAESRAMRRETIRSRIGLAKEAGLRTLLLVGAPYNAHASYGDNPPNCILDERTVKRHVLMLEKLAEMLPELDDLQIYTYDVDAWLCSEFGKCPRCRGIPLHERLPPFVNRLSAEWRKLKPDGRVWWEPWELSDGQALRTIEALDPQGLGLVMHCNSAECMATMPVDRQLKNMAAIAKSRGIPVLVQYFLGGTSEETEPFFLAHPLVTLRGLKAIAAVSGVTGIKEYYGLGPDREDPNLRMTALFFRNPAIGEDEALEELARPYGKAASEMIRFWRLTSEGMELFPWETSWFMREVGRSRVDDSLTAATLRGMDCPTPSWRASRHSIFMRIEPEYAPHPWMLEDVQLRCEAAAERIAQALGVGLSLEREVPKEYASAFAQNLLDLGRFERRSLAYAYHLRETNLASELRAAYSDGQRELAQRLGKELLGAMETDLENVRKEKLATIGDPDPTRGKRLQVAAAGTWPEMETAIDLARRDMLKFLSTNYGDAADNASKGAFSATSR